MRAGIIVLLAGFTWACGSIEVERLNLRDPRLPIEARRWLADAEDEVAIAHARVDQSETDWQALRAYRASLRDRLEEAWTTQAGRAPAQGDKSTKSIFVYADERVKLAEMELDFARTELELAERRLTQARAETAIRYDVAVYEIELIVHEVEQLKTTVAAMRRAVEDQRAIVERMSDQAWLDYAKYVKAGGVTNALWGLPEDD